uniref:ABC transporter permease n=1 Tax=Ignisphaera aggregans TaxID=334771 RepID=A0A7C5XJR9_9CREN
MIDLIHDFLRAVIRVSVPLGYAGLGELLVEKSGLLNISIEGTLWLSALFAFIVNYYYENPYYGILTGMFIGIIYYLIFGFLSMYVGLNQVLVGVALNLFAYGSTFYIYRFVFEWRERVSIPSIKSLMNDIKIPFLSEMPLLGYIFFNQPLIVYIFYIVFPIIIILLNKTIYGLYITSIGENPEVSDKIGISVFKYRLICLFIGGAFVGLGGSIFTTYLSNIYLDHMIAGRGFIVIALLILGSWSPLKTIGAIILYSFVEAFQYRFQTLFASIMVFLPYQFVLMLPYLTTVIVLIVIGRRIKPPSWLGKQYTRVK